MVDGRGKGRKGKRAKQGSQPLFGPLGGMVVMVLLTEIGSVDQTWVVGGMQVLIYWVWSTYWLSTRKGCNSEGKSEWDISLSPSIYLSIYLSINHLSSIYLPIIYQSIHLPIYHLSIYLSSINLSTYLSIIYLSIWKMLTYRWLLELGWDHTGRFCREEGWAQNFEEHLHLRDIIEDMGWGRRNYEQVWELRKKPREWTHGVRR